MRVVAVDVGNTSTTVALMLAGKVRSTVLVPCRRIAVREFSDQLHSLVGDACVDGAVISSVVPGLTKPWVAMLRRALACCD